GTAPPVRAPSRHRPPACARSTVASDPPTRRTRHRTAQAPRPPSPPSPSRYFTERLFNRPRNYRQDPLTDVLGCSLVTATSVSPVHRASAAQSKSSRPEELRRLLSLGVRRSPAMSVP